MRKPPRTRAWVMVACAIGVDVSSARAQLVQPAAAVRADAAVRRRLHQHACGVGLAPERGLVAHAFGEGSSVVRRSAPTNSLASRLNSNSRDRHALGRTRSVGVSLYSQNPEWGVFGQALLRARRRLRPELMPAFSRSARATSESSSTRIDSWLATTCATTAPASTTRSSCRVMQTSRRRRRYTRWRPRKCRCPATRRHGQMSMSFSLGYGNGLFRDDGGLGDQYNNRGSIAKGLFLGSRLVTHPWSNGSVTFLAENDGWDWNAGAVAEWRGVTIGFYGTELEEGGRTGAGRRVQRVQLREVQLLDRILRKRPRHRPWDGASLAGGRPDA